MTPDLLASVRDRRPHGSRMAGGAYWAMMRRIVVIAGSIDAAGVLLYTWLGSPVLGLLNVVSVLMYIAAYLLILRRHNAMGVALIWIEVLTHATVGSLLIGWESGFHYFLLLFIPAIVVGSEKRYSVVLVVTLLIAYLALDAACTAWAPLSPLDGHGVQVVKWINVCLIFGMFSSMAAFYRDTVLRAERRLLEQATTDPLTSLANRRYFQLRADSEIARSRRSGEPLTLLLADIDHFKRINDEFGHEAGDKVLVQLADILKANLRSVDTVARWGGEEFLALLPASDSQSAAMSAERVRLAVENASAAGSLPVCVTLSFGIAEIGADEDLKSATVRADRALYRSKTCGRNRVTVG